MAIKSVAEASGVDWRSLLFYRGRILDRGVLDVPGVQTREEYAFVELP